MTTFHSKRPPPGVSNETRGLWLGFLGVTIFAVTLPLTRIAVGTTDAPALSPTFVMSARAAIAGLLSLLYLWWQRAPLPEPSHWSPLIGSALGTVLGFPLFLGLALRDVHATHAAVVTGVLPLAGAVAAALYFRQRPAVGFWLCALLGCALVLAYAVYQGGGQLTLADSFLLLAVACASGGYLGGAKLSAHRPAPEVICWVLVISLPFTVPVAAFSFPAASVPWQAWASLSYLAMFSMWIGFFAWYRGLAIGGMVRVSQVQLVQPFLSILFAIPILGERVDAKTLLFCAAVVGTVLVSRRMPIHQ